MTQIITNQSMAFPDDKEMEQEFIRDEIRTSLVKTDKGHISNCLANFVLVLQKDPVLRGSICLNLLTERVDILANLGWQRNSSSAITDTDLNYLALYLERHYSLSSDKKLRSAVDIVANENQYHPIRDKLNSLIWDDTPRIRNCLHHFLGAVEDDYTEALMQHFLLGAIRRIFHPGCKYEEILCLVGGQGIGKSTFIRFLAIVDEGFSDDIRRLDDDKIFQRLVGHWIIEMSEMLATNNAKSVEDFSAARRIPTVCLTRRNPATVSVSVCLRERRTPWTFFRWIVLGTGDFCRYCAMANRLNVTFSTTKKPPVPTSNRCGRKPWPSTAAASTV